MRHSLNQALKELDTPQVDRILAHGFFASSEKPQRLADVIVLPKRTH